MAGIPKEHNELYFDKLCRTQKSETVLSLIQATYHAKRNIKSGENIRELIAKRLVSAYELFKDNPKGTTTGAGTYTGDYKQFESQYTIGHELCIWKNSNLDLTELALRVAKNEITIKDYFDVFFKNYFQPISGKSVHILYSILSYMVTINKKEMEKKNVPDALGVVCNNEMINALCNFLDGTSYIDFKDDKLIYVGKDSIDSLISKCNIRYIGEEGLELAKVELDSDEKYAIYITSGYEKASLEEFIEYAWYVGTTGHDENGIWKDFSEEYISNGIWKNGHSDKFIDIVKSIKVGDKIAIKAMYNQKHNIPFNCYGKRVVAMKIKAIGVVTDNPGDGRNIKVSWTKIEPNKVWFGPGTVWETIHLVNARDGFIKKSLLEFTFLGKEQDYSICEDYYKSPVVEEVTEDEQEEYSIDELGNILKDMGAKYEQVLAIHLFGIRYGQYIREKKYPIKEIISKAGLPESYFAELNKGIKLSSYVEETDDKELIESYVEEDIAESYENEIINYDSVKRLTGGRNIILYGVPGAGKSYTIETEYCKDEDKMERLVFHPDYTYSDFVGQILPSIDESSESKTIQYKFVPGPFTTLLKKAYRDPENKYYLIIEEINRGNAPAIFGDVFQLLDRKTDGNSMYGITNSDIAKIVYDDANHKVRIPSNMSILCTMNTSDQNVFTLDTAFQRRWNMRLIENTFRENDALANVEILDTKVTWRAFQETINEIILNTNVRLTSAEDKRLGTHFVVEDDLIYNKKADAGSGQEQIDARLENRRFAEKVIKYLWDDAFKFNRESLFNVRDNGTNNSLEAIISSFLKAKGADRFDIFLDNIKKTMIDSSNQRDEAEGDVDGTRETN